MKCQSDHESRTRRRSVSGPRLRGGTRRLETGSAHVGGSLRGLWSLLLNLIALPIAFFLARRVLASLWASLYALVAAYGWLRRGVVESVSSLVAGLVGWLGGTFIFAVLVPAVPLGVVAWLWPPFGPWLAGSWGVWTGVGLAAVFELLSKLLPATGAESLRRLRAHFYDLNKDALLPNLAIRQKTYIKMFETAFAEQKAAEEAGVERTRMTTTSTRAPTMAATRSSGVSSSTCSE